MEPFNWRCPFCNHDSTITSANYHSDCTVLEKYNSEGFQRFDIIFIICPNKDCNKSTLSGKLWKVKLEKGNYVPVNLIKEWNLIPQSDAKPLPNYIPKAITEEDVSR